MSKRPTTADDKQTLGEYMQTRTAKEINQVIAYAAFIGTGLGIATHGLEMPLPCKLFGLTISAGFGLFSTGRIKEGVAALTTGTAASVYAMYALPNIGTTAGQDTYAFDNSNAP